MAAKLSSKSSVLQADFLGPKSCVDRMKAGELPGVIWCEGSEWYFHRWIGREAEAALARRAGAAVERMTYSAVDELDVLQVVAPLSSMSLFGQVSYVVIGSAEHLTKEELESLAGLAPKDASQGLLVISGERLAKDFTPSTGWVVTCKTPPRERPAEWLPWVQDIAKAHGLKPDAGAQSLLVECTESLAELDSELGKLSLVAPATGVVDKRLVEQYTSGQAHSSIYDLMPAVVAGRVDRALEIFQQLLQDGEDVLRVMGYVAKECNLLWEARLLLNRRAPEADILRRLGVSSGRWYHLQQTVKMVSVSRCPEWIRALGEADVALKSGDGGEELIVEELVYRLCGVVGRA